MYNFFVTSLYVWIMYVSIYICHVIYVCDQIILSPILYAGKYILFNKIH